MNKIEFDEMAERFNDIVKQQAGEGEFYYLNLKRHFALDHRRDTLEVVFSFRYKWLYPKRLMEIVNEVLKKMLM